MKIETYYGPDTEEEIALKLELRKMEERYRAEAAPLIERLVKIHSLKIPKIFLIPEDEDGPHNPDR